MQTDEPVRRPPEIEDPSNLFVVHPIASRLVGLFAALHVRPNAVSLAGMAFGLLAAGAYYHYRDVRYAIAGFILMIAWHVMDGADGQLARLTHAQSQTGKVLDGICDYTTFIAVYVALAAALSPQSGDWVWALAVAAGLCHSAQSAAYEVQREDYAFFGLGRPSARLGVSPESASPVEPTEPTRCVAPAESVRRSGAAPPARGVFDALHRLYVRLQRFTIGADAESRERLAVLLGSQPEHAASIRQRYREMFAPAVRRWSVLSANYRTLGLFIGALLDAPQYYFEFEIVGFSAILAMLICGQRVRYRRFFRGLESAQ